ncbi:MAG: acetate--CoA ligase family protein [Thermoplasmata archaeon]
MFEYLRNPRTVAVVGASPDNRKIGNAVLDNLVKAGFSGKVYPVNPSYNEIMGLKCYPSLEYLEKGLDLVVIALPAKTAVELLDQCVRNLSRFVVIIAGGFSETGEEGRMLEELIKVKIRGSQTRVIGPNTVGLLFPHSGLNTALTPSDRLYYPEKGNIGFVSQSGALGLLVMDSITEHGLGVSGFVSIGNRADVTEVDLLPMFAGDPNTKSIVFYLESIADGEQFFSKAKEISIKKPIVILKTGRSTEAARAASFHTGAMATDDRILDGILKQSGVIRAYDEVQLMDYGKALAYQDPPRGDRIAVVTTAGGVGVVTTDLLTTSRDGIKLRMATFNESEKADLKEQVLPIASVNNPIDLTADGSTESYESILKILTDSDSVDGIIAYALPQTPKIDMDIVSALKKAAEKKTLVAGVIGYRLATKVLAELEKAKVPAFPSVRRATDAMKALYIYGLYKRRLENAS